MTNSLTADVIICGAGAAGLTLAIDLARRGVSFRLIDKLDAPFQGSRGKGIQPRTEEVFEDLGLLDRIAAAGGRYPIQRLYRADGSYADEEMFANEAGTPAEPYRTPLLVPQFLTEGVMRERLAELGHRPYPCRALQGLSQDSECVTARVATPVGEESMRARYLVGADGGRSFVRRALGTDFPGKTLGVRAIVADLQLTGLSREAWHRFNEGSMALEVSLCPLAGTTLFQLQAPIPPTGEPDLSAEGIKAFIDTRVPGNGITVEAVSWASAYTMNARLADRYRTGRVFLIGDAAHIHPPTGGQGLNTSVQDAYNLGWKLGAVLAGAPDTLLDTYEDERRPIAASMLGLATDLLGAAKRGAIRRGREVHQLDLAYLTSPLACEAPERNGGVLAGDRAPDAPMTGAGGQPLRLFDLMKGPHWTLVGYHTNRATLAPRHGLRIHTIGPRGDLLDTGGHFRDAYGLGEGEWVLLRPDGYVGAVVSAKYIDVLQRYFHLVGLDGKAW